MIICPVIVVFLAYAFDSCAYASQFAFDFATYFLLLGVGLVWTFIEYKEHRYTFHAELRLDPDAPADGEHNAAIFTRHLHHHVFMNQKHRVVIRLSRVAQSMVPSTLLVYFFVPHHIGFSFLAGVMTGFMLYDGFHYAIHHGPDVPLAWFKRMKAQHMRHHFRDNSTEFGVTTDLWDYLLGSKSCDVKSA
jgi:hypothetical protein